MSRRKSRDLRDDVEGLLFAMVIDELMGFDAMSSSNDDPEIVGLRFEEDELGVGIEPIVYDEKQANPPRKTNNKLEKE